VTTKTRTLLPLLLVLTIPSAAVTGCARERVGTPNGEVQNDRDRADVGPGKVDIVNRINVGRGESSVT